MASGSITPKQTISGTITKQEPYVAKATAGGGTNDHERLFNRDANDQHPITAITDLQSILDSKLDSETALPLIEEAVKNKAKGLYYDAAKELAKKSYWYLTSEIDPTTRQGTKASIISGPYDLGQGGGGGGVTTVTVKAVGWPTTVVAGSTVKVMITWSSVIGEAKEPTGNGTLYLTVNNKQVETKPNLAQGAFELDLTNYIVTGQNTIQVKILDSYGTTGVLVQSLNAITLELKSNFNYKLNYAGTINYTYIPYGDVEKTVYFIVDNVQYGTQTVKSTGEQQTFQINNLTHGSHTLKVYFTAKVGAETVSSNELFYDLVYYVVGNETPIIASEFRDFEQEQYIAFNIPYRVYIYGKNLFDVDLIVNGTTEKSLTVGSGEQYWSYSNSQIGNYNLQIKCGTTVKSFQVHIKKSEIDVKPVAENVALALSVLGRTNTEPLAERQKWQDTQHGISCSLTNFNWSSDGWLKDADQNDILRITGNARVTIPYKPFETDFRSSGKTIELEIATSTIRNYATTIIKCLDKQTSDFFETKGIFVNEDTRTKVFKIALNNTQFKTKISTVGTYQFKYTTAGWTYNNVVISLADYGITIAEKKLDPQAPATDPYVLAGDIIQVSYSLSARGFYLTPQIALFKSQQSSLSTQYKEDDHVRLTFVIEKNTDNRIIWMYINGIASGAVQYPSDDSFRQLDADYIEIGSNDATVDIYNIRIYDNNLTSKQVVNNWIADTQNATLKASRYHHNDNYNDKNEIVISKLPADLPYMIWDIDPLPQYKGDKRLGNVRYVEPTDTTRNFTSTNATYNVQGTSSAVYPVKNIRIKYKQNKDYPTQILTWEDDNGETIKKFKITKDGGIGDNYFTYKVDYASSEGANNVELVKLYNDAAKKLGILNPAQNKNNAVRVGIDGYPIIAFWRNKDGVETFCTKANFNNDKANEAVYGFEEGDESWEVTNNTALEANFKKAITQETFGNAFEIRFPDEDGYSDLTKLKPMSEWVVSTYKEQATGNALATPKQFTYTNIVRSEDGSYQEIPYISQVFTHDTADYRKHKFKAELKNWFNVKSTLYYYIFTHLFLLVDSRAKNAFPTYFKSRQVGDGGDRWFWLPYDMDTALGINNEGKLVFDYNLEDIDKINGANVFNGQESVIWCNLREMFDGEIGQMYAELRKDDNLINFLDVESRFIEHQSKWSENIFNEDAKVKYIAPLQNGDNYLEMLQGSKAEQRRWWLYNRFKYMDSKYLAGDAKADFIQFRAYVEAGKVKPNITIIPYADIYATASFGNSSNAIVSKRATRDTAIILENPYGTAEAETDQETYIYSASQLKSIGDISTFYPDTVKIGNAIKLQSLKVGDSSPDYENTHLTELTLGSNVLLKTLDVRNCSNLAKPVDVSGCTNIEEIYFDGTKITGISLPDGGILKHLHLPDTLTKLTIKNQPLLTDLVLAGTENIESLWLENIPSSSIDAYELISKMKQNSAVRIIGLNETFSSVQQIKNLYNLLDTMKGLDSEGELVPKAQVTGVINIQDIPYADYIELKERYKEIIIKPVQIICTVTFWNETVVHAIQNVVQGTDATTPAVPTKESTQAHYYTFNKWDKSYQNVQTDLNIYAVFDEHLRIYRATFDTQSMLIGVVPPYEDKEYGSLLDKPTCTDIPPRVEFKGWYRADNTEWNFDTDKIFNNITLYAHWKDEGAPSVNLTKVNYNTFSYHCTDNLGVTGWAVNNSETEQPTSWTTIPPTTPFDGTYQISSAGNHVFWIKDAQNNTANAKIIARSISKTASSGVSISTLKENGQEITTYALDNTKAILHVEIDEHYENLEIWVNDVKVTNDYEITINQNITINITCTPKSYYVHFNMMGRGGAIADKLVVYKTTVEKPSPQYDAGFIIDGWYKEQELTNEWNFNTDVILGEMTLYAKWIPYHTPTKITVNIPSNNYTITVAYYQYTAEEVSIKFGDDTEESKTTESYKLYNISHTYATAGNYIIEILGSGGAYQLGDNFERQVVNPVSVITDVDFSWDISITRNYAFKGANITNLKLSPYMTTIAAGVFAGCRQLTSLNFPDSIWYIQDQAFEGCSNVTGELKLPKKLTRIGNYVFSSTKITSVVFNSALTYIGKYDFEHCKQLAALNIPTNITEIKDSAFGDCTALTEVTIPENVITLGTSVFSLCTNLSKVTLSNANLTIGDYCFNYCQKLQTAGPIGSNCDIEFAWQTEIPNSAFCCSNGASNLTSISIPNTVIKIGNRAFLNAKISQVNLPLNLEYIGSEAFMGTQLTQIDIPGSVTYIGYNVCKNCRSLNKIYIRTAGSTYKPTDIDASWFLGVIKEQEGADPKVHIPSELDTVEEVIAAYGNYWNYCSDGTKLLDYVADL